MAITSFGIIIEPDLQLTSTGDIAVLESDNQNVQNIVYVKPGRFYHFPKVGVNLPKFVNSNTQDGRELRKDIRKGLEADGYSLDEIETEVTPEGEVGISVKATKLNDVI